MILLNGNMPPRRRRFTLAHEIGHVLIPWHVGTIVDDIDMPLDGVDLSYWELEGEANRFAAELLMPTEWVEELLLKNDDPAEILGTIADSADVSIDAAIIQMIDKMTPGYLYAFLDSDGAVRSSGRSEGTLAARPTRGEFLNLDSAYPSSDQRWNKPLRGTMCFWWHFPDKVKLPARADHRKWRDILNDIFTDLRIDDEAAKKFKQSFSGIIGSVNNDVRRRTRNQSEATLAEILFAACIQRFDTRSNDDPTLQEIILHEDFTLYLAGRIKELSAR